ncbi:MAG TPA: hypothetical protein DEB17_06905 [Chlorobaculum sp.]|nr:hypothetical protein [Chlorobaculum sp.]
MFMARSMAVKTIATIVDEHNRPDASGVSGLFSQPPALAESFLKKWYFRAANSMSPYPLGTARNHCSPIQLGFASK